MNPRILVPIWNIGLWRLKYLSTFLEKPIGVASSPFGKRDATWLGWGAKPSALRAKWYAYLSRGKALQLEDGFLRSWGTGDRFPPLSMVVDEQGIYYDSTRPSTLESLLNSERDLLAGISEDVVQAKRLILTNRLSKYNHAPLLDDASLHAGGRAGRRVLVIDQTYGDMGVKLACANAETFKTMLAAARAENPDATIFVKTHPEVSSGRKHGYLTDVEEDESTVVLRDAVNPLSLIEMMDCVYVVSSTLGFEAMLAGKGVTCFGLPWYSGWGVTDDRLQCQRRTRKRSLDELFAAAYFHYSRYLNPQTHQRGTIFDVIDWLLRQREATNRNHERIIGVGFRRWKAANISPMLALQPNKVRFVKDSNEAKSLKPGHKDIFVFWGRDAPDGLLDIVRESGAKLLRMEDGFVRSVGLGSDLIRPQSLVLDSRGIYFDPTHPSDLEHILSTAELSDDELKKARRVRDVIVENGITKYNLESRDSVKWPTGGKRVILVPGQVEDDASIRYGCNNINTNIGLLRAAREACADAFIVYKPHPDVMSGNRLGKLSDAYEFADYMETELSIVSCIDACDEIHTMTSLSGFDALLRGKKVVVYGQPFYAGWGLTTDIQHDSVALSRRQRRLSLDELVAGTLLRYPIYWDWGLKGYTDCEAVLHQIVEMRNELEACGGLEKLRIGFMRRQARKLGVLAYSLFKG